MDCNLFCKLNIKPKMKRINIYLALLFFILLACSQESGNKYDTQKIYKNLEGDILTISADSMLGRAPFTIGEERATSYIAGRMKEIGLSPVFDSSYFQDVPMVSITSELPSSIDFKVNGSNFSLKVDDDICLWSPTVKKEVAITNSPLVFAGFGINAPEYGWNDYADLDVKGKIVVVLVNDPGYYLKDSSMFTGYAMTYYGRWRYKFEEAERQGALGCIIVHEDGPAGYPWAVAGSKSNSPILYLDSKELENPTCKLNGWITLSAARKLFDEVGLNYDEIKQRAITKEFKPLALNASLNLKIRNKVERSLSKNVAGYIKGAENPDEFIVYTAHWDHLGVGKPVNGDSIYNGASDNAAAVAWMLSIAELYQNSTNKPKRSVVFLAPTAEESGLFGSEYFTKNCPFDISNALACFNYDVVLFIGHFKDVTVTGYGHSNLDSLLEVVAKRHNRYVDLDPNPENGMFYRSDQLPFLKAGVPSMFAKGYTHQVDLGREKTLERINSYWQNTYHKPCDEFNPEKDNLDGLVDDVILFYEVGDAIAGTDFKPEFSKKSEFFR
jgi:Zn-dependent M28 family amino/carboxypeptidase